MNLKLKEIPISELLAQILSKAVKFDRKKHFVLIKLLISRLKDFRKPNTPELHSDNEAKVIINVIVDFLLRIKDKHPFSDLVEAEIMDVLDIIMEFLFGYSFKPSEELCREYAESKVTKKLNSLPSREYLNSKFSKYNQMSEGDYNRLRKRFESRPPIVFYFNPDIEIQEKVYDGALSIGFFEKGTAKRIGACMHVCYGGYMYQGYFKDGCKHMYGREIYWCNGDIYEGGWDMGYYHGKGEMEYYADGRVEVGQWVEHKKQGEFEVYDKTGKLTHRKVYKDNKEIESEEVIEEEIYRKK